MSDTWRWSWTDEGPGAGSETIHVTMDQGSLTFPHLQNEVLSLAGILCGLKGGPV